MRQSGALTVRRGRRSSRPQNPKKKEKPLERFLRPRDAVGTCNFRPQSVWKQAQDTVRRGENRPPPLPLDSQKFPTRCPVFPNRCQPSVSGVGRKWGASEGDLLEFGSETHANYILLSPSLDILMRIRTWEDQRSKMDGV